MKKSKTRTDLEYMGLQSLLSIERMERGTTEVDNTILLHLPTVEQTDEVAKTLNTVQKMVDEQEQEQ